MQAGAYVIRNKKRSTVLHVEKNGGHSPVVAYEQNEGRHCDQQIWWVEPLPNYEDDEPEKGPVCSITIPGSGRSLDTGPTKGSTLFPSSNLGIIAKLKEVKIRATLAIFVPMGTTECLGRGGDFKNIYYTIASVFNDRVIDIHNGKPTDHGHQLHTQSYVSGYDQHCWEFVTPIVGFPPGWLEIQNAGTGDLLHHNYVCNPPVLLPPPATRAPSQYREDWGFQWAFKHTNFWDSKNTSGRNSWYIMNRLTGARFNSFSGNPKCETLGDYDNRHKWKLELGPSCNWKIICIGSSCLLEQSIIPCDGGTAVRCQDQHFTSEGGRKSWIIKPPMLRPIDNPQVLQPPPSEHKVPVSTVGA